jgi:hypothetical protein
MWRSFLFGIACEALFHLHGVSWTQWNETIYHFPILFLYILHCLASSMYKVQMHEIIRLLSTEVSDSIALF